MKKVEILVLAANAEIAKVILRLINANEAWSASGAGTVPEAVENLLAKSFDLLLLGAGFSEEEELAITEFIQTESADTRVIKHYGGGSGLLFAEIYMALA
jgi:DNA-binding NtrC family response regulator